MQWEYKSIRSKQVFVVKQISYEKKKKNFFYWMDDINKIHKVSYI